MNPIDQRWTVTGGCGFIGHRLVERLRREGVRSIRVIDDLSVGTLDALARVAEFTQVAPDSPRSSRTEVVIGDVRDARVVQQALRGSDIVVHLAANTGVPLSVEEPRADCEANVIGTFNVLEACRANGADRLVFASSGAPLGNVDPPIHEELVCRPISPYGASKLAGEAYCSAYYGSYGLDTVALRFGNVYGPGSGHKTSVVAKFIRNALAGEALEIYGDGSQTRDYIFIDDLVDAVVRAAVTEDVGGEIFQIATHHETTVSELVETLVGVLIEQGLSAPEIRYSAPRAGDVKRNFSDIRKAKERLDWAPATELTAGLRETVASFLERRQ